MNTPKPGPMTRPTPLALPTDVRALSAARAELLLAADGQDCDHSVGVCLCPLFDALGLVERALEEKGVTVEGAGGLAGQATDQVKALERISLERHRQVDREGWRPEHDDGHVGGELAAAAACYAQAAVTHPLPPERQPGLRGWLQRLFTGWATALAPATGPVPANWPWAAGWWKPSDDPARNLEKAGALLVAELERRERNERRMADLAEAITSPGVAAGFTGKGALADSFAPIVMNAGTPRWYVSSNGRVSIDLVGAVVANGLVRVAYDHLTTSLDLADHVGTDPVTVWLAVDDPHLKGGKVDLVALTDPNELGADGRIYVTQFTLRRGTQRQTYRRDSSDEE